MIITRNVIHIVPRGGNRHYVDLLASVDRNRRRSISAGALLYARSGPQVASKAFSLKENPQLL